MIYINAYSSVSALGSDKNVINNNLSDRDALLLKKRYDLLLNGKSSYFGCISKDEELNSIDLSSYKKHDSYNNRVLAYCANSLLDAISKLKEKYATDRIAVVLGTSTSGLEEVETELKSYLKDHQKHGLYMYYKQEFGDTSAFLADYLSLKGPCYTISTACSSSARAIISGKRLIESGLADAAIVGGVDTLCTIPVNGFNAMGVLSENRCIPFNENRSGINIGEAAGLMILTKEESNLFIAGTGESSDAYHISSPEPEGTGAIEGMKMALKDAGISTDDIGYINMHGTGTRLNDSMECKAVSKLFGKDTPCSSTKYLTGHTLGAAGILEAVILCQILEYNLNLPEQNFTLDRKDPELDECNLIQGKVKSDKKYMMSNSFAFGGNNTSIIIAKKS
ncbi:MAG: beta-ketoacyl-ACP synthase [Succinivibrio sp.]|nr:beta-ketoacyl-ACP synthase [Succinivibrio sp.]